MNCNTYNSITAISNFSNKGVLKNNNQIANLPEFLILPPANSQLYYPIGRMKTSLQ